MKAKRGVWALFAYGGVLAVILLTVYCIEYYRHVQRIGMNKHVFPAYLLDGIEAEFFLRLKLSPDRFFSPIHGVDRRLRPRFWHPDSMSSCMTR